MFDGDEAGIKAAIRGVDMLLKEGLNIKVLPLPPEDDPDSFVRAHSHSEVEEYIQQNEADFIHFKSSVVLKDAQNDPIKRTAAITDVLKSIAVIPDEIARMVYAKECSNLFDIDEQTILREIKKFRNKNLEQWRKEKEQQQAREQRMADNTGDNSPTPPPHVPTSDVPVKNTASESQHEPAVASQVTVQEREIINLIVNYGMCSLLVSDEETYYPITVLEYINNEMQLDQMEFADPLYRRTFELAYQYIEPYYRELAAFKASEEEKKRLYIEKEMAQPYDADPEAMDSIALINAQENRLKSATAQANVKAQESIQQFSCDYLQRALCSIDDDQVRQLACDIASDNLPQLSKIHTKFTVIVEDKDRLETLVPKRLYNWKNALLVQKINETKAQISTAPAEQQPQLMEYLQELYKVRQKLASMIGDRVVNPK